MKSIQASPDAVYSDEGLRPINLRTDLGQLADLIELVFAPNMDENGRAAIREMRYLSRMGLGINLISRVNDLALGVSKGFVWIADNRVVGNASIYPANWPRELGPAWIIANVGVHPDFQRQGIASRLMRACMESIRQRDGKHAVLQVEADNEGAKRLYDQLGFVTERTWTTWRRGSLLPPPPAFDRGDIFITRRTMHEWRHEYELARLVRPFEKGGLGWLKPLHKGAFHSSIARSVINWFTMNSTEHLIIRSEDHERIHASLQIERAGFSLASPRLTLMVHPDYQGIYDEALLNMAINRFQNNSLIIEHPEDETVVVNLLRRYRFTPRRTLTHMRWDVH